MSGVPDVFRAYIRHLLKAKEMLGMRLCVLHNLYFYNTMMEEIRDAIDQGCYKEYKEAKLAGMAVKNSENFMKIKGNHLMNIALLCMIAIALKDN